MFYLAIGIAIGFAGGILYSEWRYGRIDRRRH